MFDSWVKVEWLKDREMRLLESVSFVDKKGVTWTANKGDVIDGASIPRFFWRFIGSPFIGKYRRPSVIHDTECDKKSSPHEEVHALFYEMMRSDGVSKLKAKMMYRVVRSAGPKW